MYPILLSHDINKSLNFVEMAVMYEYDIQITIKLLKSIIDN